MRGRSQVIEAGDYKNLTATGTMSSNGGTLMGIFVASASATPTLKVSDSNGTIANTFTPTAGQYYPLPTTFSGTLTVTIGGTVDCTVFYVG